MSDLPLTFGARYAALASTRERMELEASEQRRGDFATVDVVLDRLIATAMSGERVAALIETKSKKKQSDRVELRIKLSDNERAALAEHFEVGNQEKRGSWHVPQDEVLSLGLIHAVHWTRRNPRLALSMADAERARPEFRGEPGAVAVWVLEPLFEDLFLPLKLRGFTWLGNKTVEEQDKSWTTIGPLYDALGLDSAPLSAFRPGTGWSRHTTEEIIALRRNLFESWAAAPDDVGARYRAYRIGQLVERYYAKAKKGQALRKGVLTKASGRTLTAYFGGDWLAFLSYLGEEPHQSEEIVQALPTTKLMAGASERADQVAAKYGLPPEEVHRMLAAYWQQSDHSSPVEQRVKVIKRFWTAFDELHARQRPGMPSLWGLAEDSGVDIGEEDEDGPFQRGIHARVLPDDLSADIARLWGTVMLPRWPDRVVSESAPHAQMATALGPALRFWHGAALTAWFLCEGPYSRTDIDGLANYHHRELDALKNMGFPVDGELFGELRQAQERYGEPKHAERGLVITISLSGTGRGEREQPSVSFEVLRDIITRHRQAWTRQHFEAYLRVRWEQDLRAAGDGYHRLAAERGKAPTPKQFAKLAIQPANLWFGGDITGVYGVLGIAGPDAPTKQLVLPADPRAFVQRVFTALGGQPRDSRPVIGSEERNAQWEHNQRYANISNLARNAIGYVHLQEALGRPPELKDFTRSKFSGAEVLSADGDEAWRIFSDVVQAALSETTPVAPPQLDAGTATPHPAEQAPDVGGPEADWSAMLPPSEPAVPAPPPATSEPDQEGWAGKMLKGFRRRR